MTIIVETVVIDADIGAVFDLIARIEQFPLYADFLTEVRKIDDRTYRWVAQARGITLTWDSIITEYQRPVRLAWKSIRGLQNSGVYTLTRSAHGTLVSILIEYHLPSEFLERLTAPLAAPLTHSLAAQILARVKRQVESGASPNREETAAGKPWHGLLRRGRGLARRVGHRP